jgi:hypothetical protein
LLERGPEPKSKVDVLARDKGGDVVDSAEENGVGEVEEDVGYEGDTDVDVVEGKIDDAERCNECRKCGGDWLGSDEEFISEMVDGEWPNCDSNCDCGCDC